MVDVLSPCPASLQWTGQEGILESPPLRLTHFSSFVPQLVSEKVGGAEGTKLDDDFKEMEKVMGEVVPVSCLAVLPTPIGPAPDSWREARLTRRV